MGAPVLTLAAIGHGGIERLLGRYGLSLRVIGDHAPIPGSYWGEPEAASSGMPCMHARIRPCTRSCTRPAT